MKALHMMMSCYHRIGLGLLAIVVAVPPVASGHVASPARAAAVQRAPIARDTAPLATCFAVDVSTSNWQASDGYRASDAGPVFVRSEFVRLMAELVGADRERPALLAFATFGSSVTATRPLMDAGDDSTRREFIRRLEAELRPGGWTAIHEGVAACAALLAAAPSDARQRIVLLSDGRPEAPGADERAQMAALTPVAAQLRSRGGGLNTVLYGDAAANRADPAAGFMRRLAEMGGGKSYLAPAGQDLLEVAVRAASDMADLPLAGRPRLAVDGTATIEFNVPDQLALLSVVVIRSRPEIAIEIIGPDSRPLPETVAGVLSPHTLVRTITAPAPGSYQVIATGAGEVYAATIVRATVVQIPTPTATPGPTVTPTPGPTATATIAPTATAGAEAFLPAAPPTVTPPEPDGNGAIPWPALLLALVGVTLMGGTAAGVLWRRNRPLPLPGVLVVWRGQVSRMSSLSELPALARTGGRIALASVLPDDDALADGYRLERTEAALQLRCESDSAAETWPVLPAEPVAVALSVATTVTWHPAGADEFVAEFDRPDAGVKATADPV